MNWLILTAVLVVLTIGGICAAVKFSDEMFACVSVVTFLAAIIFGALSAAFAASATREVNTFIRQKAYIETHTVSDPVENAALTNQKIELNQWLYNAQYSKSRFGGWSFYSEEIFDLEPIE